MRRICVLSFFFMASFLMGAQTIPVNSVKIKDHFLPDTYESGGFILSLSQATGGGQPNNEYPLWHYNNGRHYFTSPHTLKTNVFDLNFKLIETFKPSKPVSLYGLPYFDMYKSIRLENGDIASSRLGIIARYSITGNQIAVYDLQKEYLESVGKTKEKLIERGKAGDNLTFYLFPNHNDIVVYDTVNYQGDIEHLGFVLKPDGRILRSDPEIKAYIKENLNRHTWTKVNPDLASTLLLFMIERNGFVGEGLVSANLNKKLTELIITFYKSKNISIDSSSFSSLSFYATDRGFWVFSKPDREKVYYFDLIRNRIFLLSGVTPQTFTVVWDEIREKAWVLGDPPGSNHVVISEYSLDFLNDDVISLSSLSATSALTEPADKNAYHPVKLFDGDPKTMWIENKGGPGAGESVSVGFSAPVTIDEIRIQPGCFWAEYWKQNYRVKTLDVALDGKTYTAQFTDSMTEQSLKLPATVTFSKAEFTIRSVYPTTKWEDTAISEIAFYSKGKKVELDYSAFAQYLKKAP